MKKSYVMIHVIKHDMDPNSNINYRRKIGPKCHTVPGHRCHLVLLPKLQCNFCIHREDSDLMWAVSQGPRKNPDLGPDMGKILFCKKLSNFSFVLQHYNLA